MSKLVTRIRALFGARANGKAHDGDVRSVELQTYEQRNRSLLVGRGVICWWSGMPLSDEQKRKPNGRARD